MKRAVVMGVIVARLIGFVASRRSDRDGVRTGVWSGKTSQGLRIEIKVGKRGGNAVVEEWRIRFDSSCEKSGRVLRMLLLARATIPIVGGKFARELKFVGMWDRFDGAFAGGEARGGFSSNLAALDGTEFTALAAEKCTAHGLAWTAHLGGARTAADEGTVDLELVVDESGATMLRRPTP